MHVGFSVNKNTGHPVKFGFQVNSSYLQYLGHTSAKNVIIDLKFRFNWVSHVFTQQPYFYLLQIKKAGNKCETLQATSPSIHVPFPIPAPNISQWLFLHRILSGKPTKCCKWRIFSAMSSNLINLRSVTNPWMLLKEI